jgi:hypothetical protein
MEPDHAGPEHARPDHPRRSGSIGRVLPSLEPLGQGRGDAQVDRPGHQVQDHRRDLPEPVSRRGQPCHEADARLSNRVRHDAVVAEPGLVGPAADA